VCTQNGGCCAPNFGQATLFKTGPADIMSSYGFHSGWCSWANQCGGALYGNVYWLDHQAGDAAGFPVPCDQSIGTSCVTPGTAGDSCTQNPAHCGDHCYDSDAMWNVRYVEYYQATYDCNGNPAITYWGPGCSYRP
jgi:hypothetical protein